MIRALIVDDVPLFRRGLAATLEQMGDCSIVGEATQIADILDLARTHHPDVVLLSESLASASALEIAGLLLQAEQRGLFVLSEHATEEQLFLFLLAGAAAYETRWIASAELVQKVERISRGEYLISGDAIDTPHREQRAAHRALPALGSLDSPHQVTSQASDCPLSPYELRMLARIAQGQSTKQIAQALAISEQVAKNRITFLLNKMGVGDRTVAVVYALGQQWIDFESLLEDAVQEIDQAQREPSRPPTRRQTPPVHKTLSLVQSPTAPRVLYRLQTAFCGKARCRKCRAGEGHGPYWYEYRSQNGHTARSYIGKTLPPLVQVQEDEALTRSL